MHGAFGEAVRVDTIIAGRFRRYHAVSIWEQLRHPLTIIVPNSIDVGKVMIGTIQALWRLIWWRPDVVFAKGGFVCLPIGLAAHVLRIPLVIHDSDAHPGLTNRILSRWACTIATGAPLEYYSYPVKKTRYVGIPVDAGLTPPSLTEQAALKAKLGFAADQPLLLVTGGGLGAVRLNNAVVEVLPELLERASVALIAGTTQYGELRQQLGENTDNFQLYGFVNNMHEFMAAADLVVSRAGMTAATELAALARPTILVPNAYLTGGHQTKNAAVYADADAAIVITEAALAAGELGEAITGLLLLDERRSELSQAIHRLARPDAAREVAKLILAAK